MKNKIGSNWKRWDLHVHTPKSIVQHYGSDSDKVWQNFFDDLENLPDEFKVLGINDYLFLDGFEKVLEYKKAGNLKKIELLLPVIEFRLNKFGNTDKSDAFKRINLHIIFSDNVTVNRIRNNFLGALIPSYSLTGSETWNRPIENKEDLEAFGQRVIETSAVKPTKSPLIVGFNNLNYSEDKIFECLEKHPDFKNNYFIAVGKTEWEQLRWDGSAAEKKHIINKADFVFTASASKDNYNIAKKSLKDQGVNDLLLDCSDAHYLSSHTDKDRIGNCLTWIKADYTFEGLKQVLHEPNSRVYVSPNQPPSPPIRINSVKLNFPLGTKILRKEDKGNPTKGIDFCLTGEHTIHLNHHFTCFIGGRGCGKSTILNLIAEKALDETNFFDENHLYFGGSKIKPQTHVEIDGSSDIEFISQNEVERYANTDELTGAIYDRLKVKEDYEGFINLENKLESEINKIERQINDIKSSYNLSIKLNSAIKDKTEQEKIISSYTSEDYKRITEQINLLGNKIGRINQAKTKYKNLNEKIENIIKEFPTITETENFYEIQTNNILEKLRQTKDEKADFSQVEAELVDLTNKQNNFKAELDEFLQKQGLSEESISDYERASSRIPQLTVERNKLDQEIQRVEARKLEFNSHANSIEAVRKEFENKINEALKPLNKSLKNLNPNVKDISFQYEFDKEKALNDLFDEFEIHFKEFKPSEHSTKIDAVRNYLTCIPPQEVDDYRVYLSKLEKFGTETNAKATIRKVFERESNFEVYKLLIKKVFNNVLNFKSIKGFYDKKELRKCSFGQRCTAVVVALLMFGNKPLMIDEPEAHLDSKLVAEYLVGLIKKRKIDRQIIFATHNANFVINGDAELINILEVEDDNLTKIIPTTIENLDYRHKLLNLEGGEEAFKKRDQRLIK